MFNASETIVTPLGPLIVRVAQASDLDAFLDLLEQAEAWLPSKPSRRWRKIQ